jgi:TonB family protein
VSHADFASFDVVRRPSAPAVMRPLSFAPISGRRRPASGILVWAAPSLLFHGLLVLPTLVGLAPHEEGDDRPAHEVLFLAPLLPRDKPAQEAEQAEGLPGLPTGWNALVATAIGDSPTIGVALGRAKGTGHSLAEEQQSLASPPATDSASLADEHIYQAVDVDREVTREADAVAPLYPEQLRITGVTGAVTVEFVVDTTGRVEDGSLHVVGATHPLFAAAVRDAAPGMHFRPAVRGGHLVRQQVIQSFQFVLQPPSAAAADSTPKKPESANAER